MVDAVAEALKKREHLLVQAGTGTGKSLAYLVPAIASGKRVVVATATKALQAQLVDKDLPRLVEALAKVLGQHADVRARQGPQQLPVPAADPRRARRPGARAGRAVGRPDLDDRRAGGQAARVGRGRHHRRPRRGAVPRQRPGLAAGRVSARECLGSKCPDRVDCFAEKAREDAKEADIVVANHALLALDAFTGVQVLPEHDAVIIDEAHEFAASATDALTHELSATAVRRAAAVREGARLRADARAARGRPRRPGDRHPGAGARLDPGAVPAAAQRARRGRADHRYGGSGGQGRRRRRARGGPARAGQAGAVRARRGGRSAAHGRPQERRLRHRRPGPAGVAAVGRQRPGRPAVRRGDGDRARPRP